MRMKECTKCNQIKDDFEFSPKKTKPMFKYAWCDPCREEASQPQIMLYSRQVKEDYRAMREKSIERRKFNSDQCKELGNRVIAGEKPSSLAKEYKCSSTTIYRAIRGYA